MQNNEDAVYVLIKDHFQCDKRRVRFVALLIVALLKLADSSLAQWSLAINQTTLRTSRFKRCQRLVSQFNFSARVYAQVVWRRYGQDKTIVREKSKIDKLQLTVCFIKLWLDGKHSAVNRYFAIVVIKTDVF